MFQESENKVDMQQKLAAELLSKEEIIGKMQIQLREVTINIKLNEQKVIQYKQYVRDLQAHNHLRANCQDAPNGISYQDLQQEIMDLRMRLLEAVHRNEELSEILAQKEQQLEHQDKTSRAQARVIKVTLLSLLLLTTYLIIILVTNVLLKILLNLCMCTILFFFENSCVSCKS